MLRSTTIASGTTHCCVMMKSSDNFGSKVKFPFLKKSIDVIFEQKLYILTLYVFMSCANSFMTIMSFGLLKIFYDSKIIYPTFQPDSVAQHEQIYFSVQKRFI